MKIVISHDGKKREIEGSFSVCGSISDLRLLRDELNRAIETDSPFSFGWVDIIPDRPKVIPNTSPEPW